MPVLAISVHAARWDLEKAMRAAGVPLALLDAYDEIVQHEHAQLITEYERDAEESALKADAEIDRLRQRNADLRKALTAAKGGAR
ncbi:MAG TPA: hypothetical protein VFM37_02080 [Pseudonocardiaceae bacterium]|nr:hypothetical protein [Pseudonocardiaceae bacterium]